MTDWPEPQSCEADSCTGVALAGGRCLVHCTSDRRQSALRGFRNGGTLDFTRGLSITQDLLREILDAAPRDADGNAVLFHADFGNSTFELGGTFHRVTFQGPASFKETIFQGQAVFEDVVFEGPVTFTDRRSAVTGTLSEPAFRDLAYFRRVTFQDKVEFRSVTFQFVEFEATFKGPVNFRAARFESTVSFPKAKFEGPVLFRYEDLEGDSRLIDEPMFKDSAIFDGAVFNQEVHFDSVIFAAPARFKGTTFGSLTFRAGFTNNVGSADFTGAKFENRVIFVGVTLSDGTFSKARFRGPALFVDQIRFRTASFDEAVFEDIAEFEGAIFDEGAGFQGATFKSEARFAGATFGRVGTFSGAVFEQVRRLGPMISGAELVLDGAIFRQRVRLEVSTGRLRCLGVQFLGGVQLRVRWAEIVMDDADFAASSTIARAPAFDRVDEARFAGEWGRRSVPRLIEAQPRLISLRRAEVGNLTVSNVDLRACRFAGATNLDKLRIEGRSVFAETPPGWSTTRQTLAEEHHWLYAQRQSAAAELAQTQRSQAAEHNQGWYPAECRPPDWYDFEQPTAPDAHEITALYRHLRKGREDNKDEPGAADFYYGEMEMRRKARREDAQGASRRGRRLVVQTERVILWLYWLFSGYALRAWRALISLLAALIFFAFLFAYAGGFATSQQQSTRGAAPSHVTTTPATRPIAPSTSSKSAAIRASTTAAPVTSVAPTTTAVSPTSTTAPANTSFGGALIFAARTVIGLSRDPQPRLTWWGDVFQVLLRVLGPVLLALAVLSIRGRVKR
jgi:uncharacterized protein YjbI with pentapeptide repeats